MNIFKFRIVGIKSISKMKLEGLFIKLTNLFVYLGTPIDYENKKRSFRKTIAIKFWFSFLLFQHSFYLTAAIYFMLEKSSHVEEFTSCRGQILISSNVIVKIVSFTIQKKKFKELVQKIADFEKSNFFLILRILILMDLKKFLKIL